MLVGIWSWITKLKLHLNPLRDFCEGGSSVEEVEDDDGHDDGHARDRHHRRQVDSWN